jgi:DNA-binding XRE family transcriptional regulator
MGSIHMMLSSGRNGKVGNSLVMPNKNSSSIDRSDGRLTAAAEVGSPPSSRNLTLSLEARIGFEVRNLRKSSNLTLAKLSASSKVSQGMLSKIEGGNVSPSLRTLEVIAKALGVPFKQLFVRT